MWNHTTISHLYSIVVYGWIWKCQLEKKNYNFFLIEECNDGTYGKNCNNTCGHCDPPCDKITGKCPHGCKPGYEGVFCNKSKTQSILYYFFYQFSSWRIKKRHTYYNKILRMNKKNVFIIFNLANQKRFRNKWNLKLCYLKAKKDWSFEYIYF